jgi:hypothetical protein
MAHDFLVRAHNVLLIATIVWGLALAAPGSAEERPVDTQQSTVTVHVFKSGLFRAFADEHIIQAPLEEGVLDSAIPHVQIVIDARRIRVLDPGLSAKERQEVQTRMLGSEVLDVNRFQRISFHSVAIQRLDAGTWCLDRVKSREFWPDFGAEGWPSGRWRWSSSPLLRSPRRPAAESRRRTSGLPRLRASTSAR